MLKKRYTLLFALCAVLYASSFLHFNAYAAAEWEVPLRVEAGGGYNELFLGADATATDGYDPLWEVYALLGGQIEASFPHPEWDMVHQVFSRDIRAKAPGKTTEWLFEVDSSLNNSNFTIRWDLSRLPENYTAYLIDDTAAQQIDMRSTATYGFLYTTGIMPFRVSVYAPPDVVLPAPPKNLAARLVQGETRRGIKYAVQLYWQRNSEPDLAGYNVYRSTTQGSGYQKINGSLVLRPKDVDKKVLKGTSYYYVVTAVSISGLESGYSNEVPTNSCSRCLIFLMCYKTGSQPIKEG